MMIRTHLALLASTAFIKYGCGSKDTDGDARDTSTEADTLVDPAADPTPDIPPDAMDDTIDDPAPDPVDDPTPDLLDDPDPDTGEDALDDPDSESDAPTGLSFGEECTSDVECASGVCWDINTYDPYCWGSGCSITCSTHTECETAATAAGASTPSAATCTTRGECDLTGTGLVAVACA